jgi:inosine-uridine nucleoside N-ribohydrolase
MPIFRGSKTTVLALVGLLAANSWAAKPPAEKKSDGSQLVYCDVSSPIPVILDTDIGDDIDDTWALAMLLKCPQLDLKLITTTNGKSVYRAKLIAKLLAVARRTDVPIGMGAGGRDGTGGQQPWIDNFDLAGYKGKVHEDGVQALIDVVDAAMSPVTILSIGPSHTVASAIKRRPDIAAKADFVGMQGSVYKGYDGGKPCPEFNVMMNVPAAQKVFAAPWRQAVITPLDTCGVVNLTGERFHSLVVSNNPLIKALIENYRIWAKNDKVDASTTLFDTVAVYLALPGPKPLLKMEQLPLTVTDKGVTVIDSGSSAVDVMIPTRRWRRGRVSWPRRTRRGMSAAPIVEPTGATMTVATDWKDLEAYRDLLLSILLSD